MDIEIVCIKCEKLDKVVLITKENLSPIITNIELHHLYCKRCSHSFKKYVKL